MNFNKDGKNRKVILYLILFESQLFLIECDDTITIEKTKFKLQD